MSFTDRDVHTAFASPTASLDDPGLLEVAKSFQAADVLKLLDVLQSRAVAQKDPGRHVKRLQFFTKASENYTDKGLFLPFVRALKIADTSVRSAITEALGRVNQVENHGELMAFLKSPDAPLRQAGARALSKIGGRTVFEGLRQWIAEPGFPGRLEAIDVVTALAPQHAARALEPIASLGTGPEKTKALQALSSQALREKDPAGCTQALSAFASDPSELIAAGALSTLAAVAPYDLLYERLSMAVDDPRPSVAKAAIMGGGQFHDSLFVSLLFRKLREGPSALRQTVIQALGQNKTESAVPLLVYALELKNPQLRAAAAETLAALGKEGHVELSLTVLWLLKSRDPDVRRFGSELANTVPAAQLCPRLIEFLRDEDWWVRERVGDVLVEMAPEEILRPAAGLLADRNPVLRRFAVDLMRRLRNPAALGSLVRSAGSDPDWWVAEGAIEACAAIGDKKIVPYILDLMTKRPELQVAGARALAVLGATEASAHLAALLSATDAEVRIAAIDAIDDLGLTDQAPAVQALLEDQSRGVAARAREFLIKNSVDVTETPGSLDSQLDEWLVAMADKGSDDLLLFSDALPLCKRMGVVEPLGSIPVPASTLRGLLLPKLSITQREDLASLRDVDFSYEIAARKLRFRAHVFQDASGIAAIFRIIKNALISLDVLGLPPIVKTFADFKNGLVLVGGPTGAGKSTTLAALIDLINRGEARHVVSTEDPIEVVHNRVQGLVNQRELGSHVRSFPAALRAALRQDPDVLLIGEMRDAETISAAITAAETGHLVMGSVHTTSAAATVDRLVSAMPPAQHDHVRNMLAGSLRAIVCQYLLRRIGGGRILAAEVLINTDAVANLIRKGKAFQIPSVITTSREQGMQLMDAELARLLSANLISAEEAYMKAAVKKDFENGPPEVVAAEKSAGPTPLPRQTTIAPRPATVPPRPATPASSTPATIPPSATRTISRLLGK